MGKRFTEEELREALALIKEPEQRNIILEADDPVLWSENVFFDPDLGETPFKVKPMFAPVLRSSKKNRALRVGRQSGKTVHLCVDLCHTAAMLENRVILVFLPEKKQMNRILEVMANLLKNSPVKSSFVMGRKDKRRKKENVESDYDYEIKVSSGSVIRFFFMKNNPDKARGQRGTNIYIDEAEYLPAKAYDVILGVIKGNPSATLWASSTPSGIEGTWFRVFCETCVKSEDGQSQEFHLSTTMETNWPEIEKRLRELIYDEVTWKLEVLAEWAEAKGAIYKKESIDASIGRSILHEAYTTMEELRQMPEYRSSRKALGVDWNTPQNGVRLVEITNMLGLPRITRHEIIAYETYTQLVAVDRIIDLQMEVGYAVIGVDEGYGATQLELLQKRLSERGIDPKNLLVSVDANKREKVKIEYISPASGARRYQQVTIKTKARMVGLLGKYLESSLALPYEEDQERSGLVKEVRNFRRKEAAQNGEGFIYTEQSHSLSALQMGILVYDKVIGTSPVRYSEETIMSVTSSVIDDIIGPKKNQSDRSQPVTLVRTSLRGNLARGRLEGLSGHKRRSL